MLRTRLSKTNIDNYCRGKSWLARLPLVLFVLYVFFQHLANPLYYGILNNFNLLMHEAGHLIFMPFGETMSILGGTLTQLIVPAIVLAVFIFQNELFGANFCLAWIGDNLFSIARYIGDARERVLPLLSGDINNHDWYNLLGMWGILDYNTLISGMVRFSAIIFMTGATIFSFYFLWKMYTDKSLKDRNLYV